MGNNTSYMMTDTAITVYIDCEGYTVNNKDSRYVAVKDAIRSENYDIIPGLLDIQGQLISETNGELRLLNGVLKYNGEIIEPRLAGCIIKLKAEGFNFSRFVLFLENLADNPTLTAKDELYGFLEACSLPITDDGHFLAYKMVTPDFKDIYTRSMDNSIGAIVEMDRDDVDDNRDRTCSSGLHFCSEGYLGSYGSEGNSQIVVLKINPRDVVSIPTDYNNAKGRAERYEVVDAIQWDDRIARDFSAQYTPEPEPEVEDDGGTEDSASTFRWEVRSSETANVVAAYLTRSEARSYRNGDPDLFIWDALNSKVVVGRVDDELDLSDIDGSSDDPETRDRWEIRDSATGDFDVSFNSRKYAREYRGDDEFIWDSLNEVKVAGSVSDSVDLDDLD